jgi:hypothetical protein
MYYYFIFEQKNLQGTNIFYKKLTKPGEIKLMIDPLKKVQNKNYNIELQYVMHNK